MGKVGAMQQQAMSAFNLEQINDANEMLQHANEMLDQASEDHSRTKLVDLLTKNFFARNWWKILIVLILLAIVIPPSFTILNKKRVQHKIAKLKLESKKINEMKKELQKEVFIKKTISTKTYEERVAKFEESVTELKQTIPVLEAIARKKTRFLPWEKNTHSSKKLSTKVSTKSKKGKRRKKK